MASAAEQFKVDVNSSNDFGSMDEWAQVAAGLGDLISPGTVSRNEKTKDKLYEQQNLTAARAWDEYMASTEYQRKVADLKKAGLNPYMLAMNGLGGSSPSSSASVSTSSKKDSGNSAAGLMALIGTILKVVLG